MINNEWAYNLETNLYSVVKSNAMAYLEEDYPDIFLQQKRK